LNLDVAIVSGRASAACLELINCELFQLNDLPLRVSLLAAILTLRTAVTLEHRGPHNGGNDGQPDFCQVC